MSIERVMLEIEVTIEVDDETVKNAKEQYGLEDKKKIAHNMANILITNGLDKINREPVYWDGVVKMEGNIRDLDVY